MEADHVGPDDKPGERGRIWITGRPSLADRPSLPAGHTETWGAITRGTVLDGAVYPFPVFDR